MSIRLAIEKMQAIHSSIPGIKRAPIHYPASIDTMDLPLVLTWPGQGTSHQEAYNSLRRWDKTFVVRCYVDPATQGIRDEKIQKAIDLLQLFMEYYINPENIKLYSGNPLVNDVAYHLTINVSLDNPIVDTGIVALPYGASIDQKSYHGFELLVPIYEKW